MKKIFSLAALALALFAASCSKDKNDNGGPAFAEKKLKHTTLDENRTFSYNADGTLKEVALSNGYKETVSYEANKVIIASTSNGLLSAKLEFLLTNGKPTKGTWTYFNNMGQPTGSYVYSYEYNAKGLLKKIIDSNNDYEEYEYDANDDLIRYTNFNQGVAVAKTEFTYGNEEDKFPEYNVIRSDVEGFFFPPMSKHLALSRKETSLPGNNITSHLVYTYELDAQGYAVKGTATSQMPNSSSYSWTNSY